MLRYLDSEAPCYVMRPRMIDAPFVKPKEKVKQYK